MYIYIYTHKNGDYAIESQYKNNAIHTKFAIS